jgi:hypothetical protein
MNVQYNIEITDTILDIKKNIEESRVLTQKELMMKLIPLFNNLEAIPYELSVKEFESKPENKEYFHIKIKKRVPKSKGILINYLLFMPTTKTEENESSINVL